MDEHRATGERNTLSAGAAVSSLCRLKLKACAEHMARTRTSPTPASRCDLEKIRVAQHGAY
jgi:hypothetical protein